MNLLREYQDYVKDNPKRYWWKRKLYGWGWTPATWEGWVATLLFIGAIVINSLRFEPGAESEHEILTELLPQTALLVVLFMGLCFLKGERPRWQWGQRKDDTRDDPREGK